MIRIRLTTVAGVRQGTFYRTYVVESRERDAGLWREIGRAPTKAAAEAIKARHERPAPTHCEQCGKPLAGAAWGRCYDCGRVCCRECKGEGYNLCQECYYTDDGKMADAGAAAL